MERGNPRVPQGVTPELAGLVTPMANGVEWSLFDGGIGYDSTVLIQGPGQQGLVADRDLQAGGSLAHYRHRHIQGFRKTKRCESARRRSRDRREPRRPARRIKEITGGKGVDVVLDTAAPGLFQYCWE